MESIYKYVLKPTEKNVLELPIGSKILSIEEQHGEMVVYGLVPFNQETKERYEILIYGTGHEISTDLNEYLFLGTVKMHDGRLMLHAFYKELSY